MTLSWRCSDVVSAPATLARHRSGTSWASAFAGVVGGGPRAVVSTAAFHARVQGSAPGLGGLKETKMFLTHPRVKLSIVGSLRDREGACSASDRQDSNFKSRVWGTVSSHSSHHPQEVLLAQFSLYVHKGGLNPIHFIFCRGGGLKICIWQLLIVGQPRHPANARRWAIVCLMRARRWRLRACIAPALGTNLGLALLGKREALGRCCFDAGPSSQKLGRIEPALARRLAFDGLPVIFMLFI